MSTTSIISNTSTSITPSTTSIISNANSISTTSIA